MTEKLFEQGAYHESGHIIMAYLSKFNADNVSLILNDPGSGFTKFDYGDIRITLLIAAMQNYSKDPSIFNELDSNIKNAASQVGFKIAGTLMGGPVSEAFYKSGIDFNGGLPIEMSGPDLLTVESIDLCLSQKTLNHNPNFIYNTLTVVVSLIKQENVWKSIEHLSSTIMKSPNKKLSRLEIEDSLNQSGYLNFIK